MAKPNKKPAKVSTKRGKPPTQFDAVAFLQSLQLHTIRLIESRSVLRIKEGTLPTGFKHKYTANVEPREQTRMIVVEITYEVFPVEEDRRDDLTKSFILIEAKYQCIFKIPEDSPFPTEPPANSEDIYKMGLMILAPYARQHISAISQSMGLPPITLPLVRVQFSAQPPEKPTE